MFCSGVEVSVCTRYTARAVTFSFFGRGLLVWWLGAGAPNTTIFNFLYMSKHEFNLVMKHD